MILRKITVHNFRSIKHQDLFLNKYSLLVGENNSGKTNIMRALRIFYEDNIKYDEKTDFPKFKSVHDQESWIELEFLTTPKEQEGLKDEYRTTDRILKVRKLLKTTDKKFTDKVKANQSNIFAYENGALSTNYFYGAKNISQAKLGNVVFIPELSKVDDSLKMSGPSPLRDMINFVMKKVVKSSESFSKLDESFEEFNKKFKEEESKDGFSIKELVKDVNDEVKNWNIKFGIMINSIDPDAIVKNLVSHYIEDGNLGHEKVNIDSFGQGLQRHLIYTLIKLSTKYSEVIKAEKKDFSPDFTLILFEEPEAFLHPSQQENLNLGLLKLADDEDQQVLASTHSPIFVSRKTEDLASLIRLNRKNEDTAVFQATKEIIESLFDENTTMFKLFKDKLSDTTTSEGLKSKIRQKKLASDEDCIDIKLEEESLKYFLWFDSERASAFFARHVVICEGASEKIFLDYLLHTCWQDLRKNNVYFLDAMGKFNIHRYMNLFKSLGIDHSVLTDTDDDTEINEIINTFIQSQKNAYTKEIVFLHKNLEEVLGIPQCERYRKPLNIMYHYSKKKISDDKLKKLKEDYISKLLPSGEE
jgi:predicted ATP-dependent endonuclease of OLD family